MKKIHLAPLAIALAAFTVSSTPVASAAEKEKLDITVSILPHAFLVKSIGGDHVKVNTLVAAGADPHQFNITPAQTIALSKADAFFTSAMAFETQFILKIRANAKDLKIVPINQGIHLTASSCNHDHGHAHAEEGEEGHDHGEHEHHEGHEDHAHAEEEADPHHGHDHGPVDPHTWTSPAYLGIQADTVCETLKELAPELTKEFEANRDKLLNEIFEADAVIAENLKPHKGKSFFVFHPAFSYFASTYGLTEKSIEFEGKQPSPKQLLAILKEARAAEAKALFVEPQFDTTVTAEIGRKIGAELVFVDPLTEDILTSLTDFSKALAESFAE